MTCWFSLVPRSGRFFFLEPVSTLIFSERGVKGQTLACACAHEPVHNYFNHCDAINFHMKHTSNWRELANHRYIHEFVRMSEKPVYTFRCASNCELKSVFVHAGAISRLRGQAQSLQQKWLCDEVYEIMHAAYTTLQNCRIKWQEWHHEYFQP